MSNDQSPPARKVIPYKKGGARKSPFADMAFQFSGTALDVAIQQREEGVGESPSDEISAATVQGTPESAQGELNDSAPEVESPQEVNNAPPELRGDPAVTASPALPSSKATVRTQPRQRKSLKRDVRLVPDKKRVSAALEESDPCLRDFITRWSPFLTETQLSICEHVYNNSVAFGDEYCFTSTAKLMAAVSKTERQVKTVVNQLIDWGFLVKGETIVNTPRENRGTYYKLIVDKI